jgi:hypothetical protein
MMYRRWSKMYNVWRKNFDFFDVVIYLQAVPQMAKDVEYMAPKFLFSTLF